MAPITYKNKPFGQFRQLKQLQQIMLLALGAYGDPPEWFHRYLSIELGFELPKRLHVNFALLCGDHLNHNLIVHLFHQRVHPRFGYQKGMSN